MKEKIANYLTDVMKEMRKVTWPTRDELKESTVIVLVSSLIVSVVIFGIDKIIELAMRLLVGS